MGLLNILHYPNDILREEAKAILEVDKKTSTLLADMAETMYDAPGIGLAAPQVGILSRAVVIDVGSLPERVTTRRHTT